MRNHVFALFKIAVTLPCHVTLPDCQIIFEIFGTQLCDEFAEAFYAGPLAGQSVIMIAHQPADLPDRIIIHLQPAHNAFCQLRRSLRVSIKMIHAIYICRLTFRFPNIVKQRGIAEHRRSRYRLHHFQGMVSHIVQMILVVLRCLHHRIKLREKYMRKPKVIRFL